MASQTFIRRSRFAVPVQEAFAWHERPGAFERLTPAWESVKLVEQTGGIRDGAQVVVATRVGPVSLRWRLVHRDYVADRQFCDEQQRGPFTRWRHLHRFEADGPDGCFLEDHIEYALPLGGLGTLLAGRFVRRKLQRLFTYRHQVTLDDLAAHRKYAGRGAMKILITGASGLVGSALAPLFTTGGHTVMRLVRKQDPRRNDEILWDPAAGKIDPAALEGFDAVVHLAGENIAGGRWNEKRKARIRDSRVEGTRLLAETLAKLSHPPKALVCASAIGFYGDRGDTVLDEQSPAGIGFLPDVCREWEAASAPAEKAGIRLVRLRFGVILSPAGGALKQMLLPFKLGAGGRVGSGRQYMSWITLDDAVGAIYHALNTDSLRGPVNAVAPHPVTNAEFTKALGKTLHRPTIFPVPAFAARLAFGELADALLLASTRVRPVKLLASGYAFRQSEIEPALRHVLGKS